MLIDEVRRMFADYFGPSSGRCAVSVLFGLLVASLAAGATENYTLGSGDRLQISVTNHDELKLDQRVNEDGKIRVPYLGDLSVSGLSEASLANKIAAGLVHQQIVRDPQVIVTVKEFRSREVALVGEVKKPGQYYLSGKNRTIMDMLAEAGWLTPSAADYLLLLRPHAAVNEQRELRLSISGLYAREGQGNVEIQPGDTIVVPRMDVVYVYGEVHKPGAYRLERGMTVMQAIAVAGGLTEKGTERGLSVERGRDGKEPSPIEVTLTTTLQSNDVLRVKESLF